MNVSKFLFAWLKADPEVGVIVGTGTSARIYPATAPQSAVSPFITFQVVSSPQSHTLDVGPAGLSHPRVQLDCWSRTSQAQVQQLSQAIKGTASVPKLNGYQGIAGGVVVQGCHLIDERDEYLPPTDASDEGWHRVSQDYEIWLEE